MLCHILQSVLAHSPGHLTSFLKMLKMFVGVRHINLRRSPACLKVFHGIFEDIFWNNAVPRHILVKYSECSLTFLRSDFINNSYVAWGGKTEIYSVDESKKIILPYSDAATSEVLLKGALKNFAVFTGKQLSWSHWKETPTQVFSCNTCVILKTVILKNICERLLLDIIDRGIAENYGV